MIKVADIAVYSADGKLQLIVEVKNRGNPTTEWAATMRRNLYAHSVIPLSPFFLLALPERFYLWKQSNPPAGATLPDYEIDAVPILARYIDSSAISVNNLSEYGLELVVTSWLNDLCNRDLTQELASRDELWLFDSGLIEAIRNGSVHTEAAYDRLR